MKVGDILDRRQLERLPVGSVVVIDSPPYYNTVTRTDDGFRWTGGGPEGVNTLCHEHIYIDRWTLVHLPGPVAPVVGERIETRDQASALPIGSVVVDLRERTVAQAPAIKGADDTWAYWNSARRNADTVTDGGVFRHTVIHIPGDGADTGAGRTAA